MKVSEMRKSRHLKLVACKRETRKTTRILLMQSVIANHRSGYNHVKYSLLRVIQVLLLSTVRYILRGSYWSAFGLVLVTVRIVDREMIVGFLYTRLRKFWRRITLEWRESLLWEKKNGRVQQCWCGWDVCFLVELVFIYFS